jgi:Na+/melibiose symporter-like transporter
VGSYLAYFYTDVFKVPAMSVSLLFLISRFWDAVNDPIIGTLADRTKSRWGRYRPWIMFCCVPLGIITVLTFTAFSGWSNGAKIAYMYITYGVLVLVYTMVNIPYSAMTAAVTQDPGERGGLASIRLACAVGGYLILAQVMARLLPALQKISSVERGYTYTAMVLSGSALFLYALGVATHKEVVLPPPVKKKNQLPILKMIHESLKIPEMRITTCAHFVSGFYNYGRSAVLVYYFYMSLGM